MWNFIWFQRRLTCLIFPLCRINRIVSCTYSHMHMKCKNHSSNTKKNVHGNFVVRSLNGWAKNSLEVFVCVLTQTPSLNTKHSSRKLVQLCCLLLSHISTWMCTKFARSIVFIYILIVKVGASVHSISVEFSLFNCCCCCSRIQNVKHFSRLFAFMPNLIQSFSISTKYQNTTKKLFICIPFKIGIS